MKLKEFNPENCIPVRAGKTAVISINCKTGLFNINQQACELTGLRSGDSVVLLQDEEDTDNWYLEIAAKGKGFEVRSKANVTKGVLFNNAQLAREIANSVAYTKTSGRILVAGKPTKEGKRVLWGLLLNGLVTINDTGMEDRAGRRNDPGEPGQYYP